VVCVAYGISSRIAKEAVNVLRRDGIRVGLIRPQTLWPFPSEVIRAAADHAKAFLVTEMSLGQMLEDVRLAVEGKRPVDLYCRLGGVLPSGRELIDRLRSMTQDYA
jgi:2-oxoglutarate ferredoxin oxidoreductase subunit alpha